MSKTNTLLIRTPEGIVFSQELAGPLSRFSKQSILLRHRGAHRMRTAAEVSTEAHLRDAFRASVAVTGEGDSLTVHIP